MNGIARLGDSTTGYCKIHQIQVSGTIVSASTNVGCNGMGVARLGDIVLAECGHTGTIVSASSTDYCNGMGVARLGDTIDGDYEATIVSASTDTFADDLG